MSNAKPQVINFDQAADMIAESKIESSLDIGHSIVYVLTHPKEGALVLFNSAMGSSAFMALSQAAEGLSAFA